LATAIIHPDEPFKYLTEAELKKALPETPIQWEIGARCEYSNLGVGLLGHALVHASKAESYEALVTARVLKALGMGDTTITLNDSQKKRLIPGHSASGKRMPNWDFPCLAGCGAIRSTVGDMLKFVKANVNPTGPMAAAIQMAHQNWRDVRPKLEEAGLCWVRYMTGKKDPPVTIWHNGQTGGYHSFVGFVPGRGGVVVLCNVATFDVDKVGAAVLNHLVEAK
jgi:CubicO group peptidase (beta-lactamase class C family)